MGRGWKIALAVLVLGVVLLALNALAVSRDTKPAQRDVAGAEILRLPGGELQVLDRGPRAGDPIVLLHCHTCSIGWWSEVLPALARRHRVVAIDLLGHGGSAKPERGYAIPEQARLVASALGRLGVKGATVVGHSLGGAVAVALAEESRAVVERLVVVGSPPDGSYGNEGLLAALTRAPLLGEGLWRIKPDFTVRDGLGVAFAPDFEVPQRFVDAVQGMTHTSYKDSHDAFDEYTGKRRLDVRVAQAGIPVLALFGEQEQIVEDPRGATDAFRRLPRGRGVLLARAGHSPNVEEPRRTARLILAFATGAESAMLQERVQHRRSVRGPS